MEFNRQKLQLALKKSRNCTDIFSSIHIFDTVSSTNTTAWELFQQDISLKNVEPEHIEARHVESKTLESQHVESGFLARNCVVIATSQTVGRGQWGRKWHSPQGGLYLSVALTPYLEVTHGYQLTIASAWGIAQQLQDCGISVGIKWPNDLVLDGYKLGGILTETKVHKELISQAVIGVGINWENSTPETGINLKTWQASQNNPTSLELEELAVEILQGIESGIHCLEQEGIDILLSHYVRLLVNVGDRVYINSNPGTIIGVNQTGCLHVRMEYDSSESVTTPYIDLPPGTISLGYRKNS